MAHRGRLGSSVRYESFGPEKSRSDVVLDLSNGNGGCRHMNGGGA